MNIPDHISESLGTIFWVKILRKISSMRIRDPGIFLTLDPGWKKFGSGSATLTVRYRLVTLFFFLFYKYGTHDNLWLFDVQEHGYNVPPITDTTRSVLIKKLNQLDQQRRQDQRQATPRKQGQNKDIKTKGQGCKGRILQEKRPALFYCRLVLAPPPLPRPGGLLCRL
jgi:hypothetical protein